MATEKNDVFIGNLGFTTTEDQVRELFNYAGPVKAVRIQFDKESGRSKGFAFIEYYDTISALSAIKFLEGVELNGRKVKVGYPSQSNLREIAKQIFHEIKEPENIANGNLALYIQAHAMEQHLINSLKFEEAWDVLEAMKKLVDDESKEQRVRVLLETYPQLITAMYELQKRMGLYGGQPIPMQLMDVAGGMPSTARGAYQAGYFQAGAPMGGMLGMSMGMGMGVQEEDEQDMPLDPMLYNGGNEMMMDGGYDNMGGYDARGGFIANNGVMMGDMDYSSGAYMEPVDGYHGGAQPLYGREGREGRDNRDRGGHRERERDRDRDRRDRGGNDRRGGSRQSRFSRDTDNNAAYGGDDRYGGNGGSNFKY